jgi:hypothetical protein
LGEGGWVRRPRKLRYADAYLFRSPMLFWIALGEQQQLENDGNSAIELIHRIERIIVHPENPDSESL